MKIVNITVMLPTDDSRKVNLKAWESRKDVLPESVDKEFSRKCVATRNGNTNDTLLMQTKALALDKTPGISNVEVTEDFID